MNDPASNIYAELETLAEGFEIVNDPGGYFLVVRKDEQVMYIVHPFGVLEFIGIEILKRTSPAEFDEELAWDVGDIRVRVFQERLLSEVKRRDVNMMELVKEDLTKLGRIVELEFILRQEV